MTACRLFVANDLSREKEIVPASSQTHYLLHVLRLAEGAPLFVFDGRNGEWAAEIGAVKKRSCVLKILRQVRSQSAPQDITAAFAPLKQARLDYLVQKAVELGASFIQPVLTAYTAVAAPKAGRMRANAIEAAEQCGILTVPDIGPAMKLEGVLKACEKDRVVVFCDERAPVASPLEALSSIKGSKLLVLTGPEGGFSMEERDVLRSKEFVCPISLGPRIMRADTAAVAALTLVNAVLGDWR
jgi:16S rRNA (uracil1498-N3)-methyltransferase